MVVLVALVQIYNLYSTIYYILRITLVRAGEQQYPAQHPRSSSKKTAIILAIRDQRFRLALCEALFCHVSTCVGCDHMCVA